MIMIKMIMQREKLRVPIPNIITVHVLITKMTIVLLIVYRVTYHFKLQLQVQ